jgi:dihydrofolate reductase
MISLIVARARNGAIGKDNTIPWRAPEDLAFFQRETNGGALIMGRNTWDSLPFKPLKGRLNLVVSSRPEFEGPGVDSVDAAVAAAKAQGYGRIYGMGGHGIYAALLPRAHRMLITEVDLEIAGADTFFPDFDPADWVCINQTPLRADGPRCIAFEYLRRQVS